MTTVKILVLLWIYHFVFLQGSELMENESIALPSSAVSTGTATFMTLKTRSLDAETDFPSPPSPTESAALSVAATGVISFIVILVVIVVILVCVVSLRFKCHHCKDTKADKKKPQHPVVSYSCSDAETTAGMKNVLLVSMKDLNTSNNKDPMKSMVTYEE
ncbi:endothelial cell-specific chemotaxis regulator isoform X2 [Anolis carolinensis]|uniref:endothelial cell-specific chemotaxis regulator isoform X2 n=1 Tax=Anolis carolinensis TaxID=28377 RepID=UPI0004626F11|nr:PREDICTED: endothelial cell-specific chemotaxis regulator [Anolis carolinensis]|eukprot:XP_008107273.1 PREDICTED: endothelial cell-specific chemotaxis regulator [Anolis carolinensis]